MNKLLCLFITAILVSSCSTSITGNVRLLDETNRPLTDANYQQITINIIKTNSSMINEGSFSLTTDETGYFNSRNSTIALTKGTYKIEAFKPGFTVDSKELEIKSSETLEFKLRRLKDIDMKAHKENTSELDVSTSEGVSIQPPL